MWLQGSYLDHTPDCLSLPKMPLLFLLSVHKLLVQNKVPGHNQNMKIILITATVIYTLNVEPRKKHIVT